MQGRTQDFVKGGLKFLIVDNTTRATNQRFLFFLKTFLGGGGGGVMIVIYTR